MTLKTRPLRLHLLSHLGMALPGAQVTAQLSVYEMDGNDVVPLLWVLSEDPAVPGDYVGPIWPNARGNTGSKYTVVVQNQGKLMQSVTITVDDAVGVAVVKLAVTAPPYPNVYEASAEVLAARTFSDSAGTSASHALQARQQAELLTTGFGDVLEVVSDVTEKRDLVVEKAAATEVNAGIAASARDIVLAQANPFPVYPSIAAGLAAAATATEKRFTIYKGGIDGLKRATSFDVKDGIPVVIGDPVSGSEYDEQFPPGYESDLCGIAAATVDDELRLIDFIDLKGDVHSVYQTLMERIALKQLTLGSDSIEGADGFETDLCDYAAAQVDAEMRLLSGAREDASVQIGSTVLEVLDGFESDLCGTEFSIVDVEMRQLQSGTPQAGEGLGDYGTACQGGDSAFVVDAGESTQVATYDAKTGRSVVLAAPGRNVAPAITNDRRVIYTSRRNGLVKRYWQELAGGAEWPFDPAPFVSNWGDSMTAMGSGYGPTFAGMVTRPTYVQGIGGQRTRQIAQRMGAVPISCVVDGGVIPASGGVLLTGLTLLTSGGSQTIKAEVAGIKGTVLFNGGLQTYTFTRDIAGAAVPAFGEVKFVPLSGLGGTSDFTLILPGTHFIFNGRNDVGKADYSADLVLADTVAMVQNIKAVRRQFLIMGPCNGMVDVPVSQGGLAGSDNSAKARLDQVLELNARMKTEFGTFYLDPLAAAKAGGFTTDFVIGGTTYTVNNNTFSTDSLHPNEQGKLLLANTFHQAYINKGYDQ